MLSVLDNVGCRSVESVIIEIEVHLADESGWRLAWNRSRRGGAFILNQKDGCTRQPSSSSNHHRKTDALPDSFSASRTRLTLSRPIWGQIGRKSSTCWGSLGSPETQRPNLSDMRLAFGAWRDQRNIFPGMAKTKSNRCLTSVYWLRASTLLTVAVGNISCKGPPLNR